MKGVTQYRLGIALALALGLWTARIGGPVSAQPRSASAQPPSNQASETVPGQVLIILATRLPGVVDPRLSDVPALRRPPFDSFRSMALLNSPTVNLRVGQAEDIPLPNGRRLRLVLQEITSEGRYRVRASINRPQRRDYLPAMSVVASPGDPFFVAGQSFQQGTLVIGIRLGQRPTQH